MIDILIITTIVIVLIHLPIWIVFGQPWWLRRYTTFDRMVKRAIDNSNFAWCAAGTNRFSVIISEGIVIIIGSDLISIDSDFHYLSVENSNGQRLHYAMVPKSWTYAITNAERCRAKDVISAIVDR